MTERPPPAKPSLGYIVAVGVALLIGAAAEIALTGLLVAHVPWLGWPIAVLSVLGLAYAIRHRLKRRRAAAD